MRYTLVSSCCWNVTPPYRVVYRRAAESGLGLWHSWCVRYLSGSGPGCWRLASRGCIDAAAGLLQSRVGSSVENGNCHKKTFRHYILLASWFRLLFSDGLWCILASSSVQVKRKSSQDIVFRFFNLRFVGVFLRQNTKLGDELDRLAVDSSGQQTSKGATKAWVPGRCWCRCCCSCLFAYDFFCCFPLSD